MLFSSFPSCCMVEAFGERRKKSFVFFFFKGACYFSWNEMLETLCHQGLLAWDLLVFTSGWISSNSTEFTGSALIDSFPPWMWGQPYPAKLFSGTSHGPSPVPGRRMGINGCRAKRNANRYQLSLWDGLRSAGTWLLEGGGRGQSQQNKNSYQQKCVILAGMRENWGNIHYFVTYFPTRLCPTCNSLPSFRSPLDLALWVWTTNYFQWYNYFIFETGLNGRLVLD